MSTEFAFKFVSCCEMLFCDAFRSRLVGDLFTLLQSGHVKFAICNAFNFQHFVSIFRNFDFDGYYTTKPCKGLVMHWFFECMCNTRARNATRFIETTLTFLSVSLWNRRMYVPLILPTNQRNLSPPISQIIPYQHTSGHRSAAYKNNIKFRFVSPATAAKDDGKAVQREDWGNGGAK